MLYGVPKIQAFQADRGDNNGIFDMINAFYLILSGTSSYVSCYTTVVRVLL